MPTSTSTTIDAVAPRSLAIEVRRAVERRRPDAAETRGLRRALDVIADLGALVLIAWLIPFVILAIVSPIVLIVWGARALIR